MVPLTMMQEGSEGNVSRVKAGKGLQRRLIEMGFTENARIRLLRTDRRSLIVAVNDSTYALSKGIAMKVLVSVN